MKQNDNIHLEISLKTFHKGISCNVAAAEMTFYLGPDIFRIRGVMVSVAVTVLCLNVLTVFTYLMAHKLHFLSQGALSLGTWEVVN
jgi:hypothetical protein